MVVRSDCKQTGCHLGQDERDSVFGRERVNSDFGSNAPRYGYNSEISVCVETYVDATNQQTILLNKRPPWSSGTTRVWSIL